MIAAVCKCLRFKTINPLSRYEGVGPCITLGKSNFTQHVDTKNTLLKVKELLTSRKVVVTFVFYGRKIAINHDKAFEF